ncbi:hypothetical protein ACP4OV_021760 [Aristida adscensionis]
MHAAPASSKQSNIMRRRRTATTMVVSMSSNKSAVCNTPDAALVASFTVSSDLRAAEKMMVTTSVLVTALFLLGVLGRFSGPRRATSTYADAHLLPRRRLRPLPPLHVLPTCSPRPRPSACPRASSSILLLWMLLVELLRKKVYGMVAPAGHAFAHGVARYSFPRRRPSSRPRAWPGSATSSTPASTAPPSRSLQARLLHRARQELFAMNFAFSMAFILLYCVAVLLITGRQRPHVPGAGLPLPRPRQPVPRHGRPVQVLRPPVQVPRRHGLRLLRPRRHLPPHAAHPLRRRDLSYELALYMLSDWHLTSLLCNYARRPALRARRGARCVIRFMLWI